MEAVERSATMSKRPSNDEGGNKFGMEEFLRMMMVVGEEAR